MKFSLDRISNIPSRVILNSHSRISRFKIDAQRRFPKWFGLPTLGPYIQLYREDTFFKTKLSIFNYCSTFQAMCDVRLEYQISLFDRSGIEIGLGKVVLETGESSQEYLADLVAADLDEYGMFSVMARPFTNNVEILKRLGATTCQFMTIYCPTDCRVQAPQIIHSHKLAQNFWLPKAGVVRNSSVTEDFSLQNTTEFYFINPCRSITVGVLHVLDINTGHELNRREITVPGYGVGRIDLPSLGIFEINSLVAFKYSFDRPISHQKPIIFRHQKHGVITCNHS
jgi:hypothetical protein